MTKISGNTPHIPQTDTPQAPVEKTGVAAPQSGQAPAVKDEVGDIPGAPTVQHQVDLPPEEAISSLKSLAQNMNTSDHGNVSSRGDVDIAVDPNATFDMNSLPGALNASAGMIEQNPAMVSATLNSVNSSLQQSQQASYAQVFQQGTYQPGTMFSGGTTLSDALSGSGSSMSLNASAQRTLENLCSEGLPTDPMAFVQFVLRESYLETTNVLMDHANKVRFFNDVKKEIRAKAQELRDVLAQHAGKEDTDVIGNTQTEDINQSFYGQTTNATASNTARKANKAKETKETKDNAKQADADYRKAKTKTKTKTISEKTIKHEYDYRGEDKTDGIKTQADRAYDSTEVYVNDMSDEDSAAHQKNGTEVTFKTHSKDYDTVGPNEWAKEDATVKIKPGMTKKEFLKRLKKQSTDAVTDAQKTFETLDSGGIGDLHQSTSTVTFPKTTTTVPKQTAAELAAAHPNSPMAQAATGNAISSQSYSSSDVSLGQNVTTKAEHENALEKYEQQLNSVGDDAQLANVDLQNWLQKQQQTMQMMSNISKLLHDTAMAIIRKIG